MHDASLDGKSARGRGPGGRGPTRCSRALPAEGFDVEGREAGLVARRADVEELELDDVPVRIRAHHGPGDAEVGGEQDARPCREEVEPTDEVLGVRDVEAGVGMRMTPGG